MRKIYCGLTEEEEAKINSFCDNMKVPYSISIASVYAFMSKENRKNGMFANCIVSVDRVDAKSGLMIQRIIGW